MCASNTNLNIITYAQFHHNLSKAKVQQSAHLSNVDPIKSDSVMNVGDVQSVIQTLVTKIFSIVLISVSLILAHGYRYATT